MMSAVEPVAELIQVALNMHVVQPMKSSLDEGFGVGNDGVSPVQDIVSGFARSHRRFMRETKFAQTVIDIQSVGANRAVWCDLCSGEGIYAARVKPLDRSHPCETRLAVGGKTQCDKSLDPVCTASSVAQIGSTKVGFVQFHNAIQLVPCISVSHCRSDFVQHPPRSVIRNRQFFAQFQCGVSAVYRWQPRRSSRTKSGVVFVCGETSSLLSQRFAFDSLCTAIENVSRSIRPNSNHNEDRLIHREIASSSNTRGTRGLSGNTHGSPTDSSQGTLTVLFGVLPKFECSILIDYTAVIVMSKSYSHKGKCPNGQQGCIPKENKFCKIATCAFHKGVKLCFECSEFPCETTKLGPISYDYCRFIAGKGF